MQTEMIFAGFGGQGILFAGQLMAYAAMDSGKEVTWIPSYGPEMSGGTANCTVIVADEMIGAPTIRNPKAALVFNLPSFDKYEPLVKEGGVLVVNQSLVDRDFRRRDCINLMVPANQIAEELGNRRLANMVMLGAMLAELPVLPVEAIEKALADHIPERHKQMLPLNCKALRTGIDYAQSILQKNQS